MKIFKILSKIFLICAVTLFLASFVICSVDLESQGNVTYMASIGSYTGLLALGTVGAFLLSASNGTAQKVGHGLILSSFAMGLTVALLLLETSSGAILMLVAVIALAVHYLFELILSILKKSGTEVESPEEDVRISRVKEWKAVLDEGIITPEEYEEKRCQILGIKRDKKESK